ASPVPTSVKVKLIRVFRAGCASPYRCQKFWDSETFPKTKNFFGRASPVPTKAKSDRKIFGEWS
ncbi:MAG: hypothetical protein N3B10_12445, partial [Armatimonadetes bacterium]|nr:hypothetical protein [Armatimonadota bacterium]